MAWKRPPVSSKPLVWLDTETTGLDPFSNDIIQIAIVRIDREGVEQILDVKLKMERPGNAHPKALEVNGYTEEGWADAEDPAEFWPRLHKEGWLDECIVAGQNPKFDTGFLNASFKRHGIKYRVDYHVFDTCVLMLEHMHEAMESISLVPCCVALGIPVKNAHTALGDVRLAQAVYKTLYRIESEMRRRLQSQAPARLAAWKAAGKPKVWPQEG